MPFSFTFKKNASPIQDTEQQVKRHIFSLLLIRTFLYATLVVVMAFFKTKGTGVIMPELPLSIAFVVLVTVFTTISVIIIQRSSFSHRKTGNLQLFADTILIAILVYGTGCSQSIFTPIFIVPILAGGLIFYHTGGLIHAASSTMLYGFILLLEHANILPGYFVNSVYQKPSSILAVYNLFAIYGIIFFVVGFISGQMAGRVRQAERKLSRTSLEFDRLSLLYKQIFDDIVTGIITTNEQDCITSYNNAAQRITGYTKEEVLGRPFSTCFPEIQLIRNNERSVCNLIKADKTTIRVGFSFSRLNMPVEPGDNEKTSWKVITLQDISKIESMEKQIRDAEKMAAIGQLSASIAHDFRNPLAAITGSAQILAMDDATSAFNETQKTLVTIIEREANRMAKTITDFLQFARPAEIAGEWFKVNRLIDEVIHELKNQFNHRDFSSVTNETEAHMTLWGDRQQIQTAFKHLFENALNATESIMEAKIKIKAYEVDGEKDAPLTCITVCDNGEGIGDQISSKIFNPFFSTREDGTGMGLSIVRQIVENHGGTIEIEAGETYNTVFKITLPSPSTYQQPA